MQHRGRSWREGKPSDGVFTRSCCAADIGLQRKRRSRTARVPGVRAQSGKAALSSTHGIHIIPASRAATEIPDSAGRRILAGPPEPTATTDCRKAHAMTPPGFDTFSAARALEAAGVERPQAEAIASAIGHSGEYTTRADLAALESRLESRMYRALWIQGGAVVAVITALNQLS